MAHPAKGMGGITNPFNPVSQGAVGWIRFEVDKALVNQLEHIAVPRYAKRSLTFEEFTRGLSPEMSYQGAE